MSFNVSKTFTKNEASRKLLKLFINFSSLYSYFSSLLHASSLQMQEDSTDSSGMRTGIFYNYVKP